MSEVKVTTLSNGLRVAVDPMPEVESASLGIWVACGTRHESAELNGMAHMLEHMIAHDDIVARFVRQRVKRGEDREFLKTRYRCRGRINLQSFGVLYHLRD